jgi:hypothetical protein
MSLVILSYMNSPTQTINQAQLMEILRDVKGATPLTISALVDARARKTGNPFAKILKLSKVNGMTGADYEKSVNRQLDREGKDQLSFTANERKWGERIGPALVSNGGKLYLVIHPQRTAKPVYFGQNETGLRHVSKETIAAFLPAPKPATNQGTDKEIVYRNYSLENITALSIGGKTYRVRASGQSAQVPVRVSAFKESSFTHDGRRVKPTKRLPDAAQVYDEARKEEDSWPEGWDDHKS